MNSFAQQRFFKLCLDDLVCHWGFLEFGVGAPAERWELGTGGTERATEDNKKGVRTSGS